MKNINVLSQKGKIALSVFTLTMAFVFVSVFVVFESTDSDAAIETSSNPPYIEGDFAYRLSDSEPYVARIVNYLGLGGEAEIPVSITTGGNTYLVKIISTSAFHSCTMIESIIIPEGVEIIEDYAFCGCSGIEVINIPASVIELGVSTFDDCTSLREINVAPGNPYFSSIDGVLFDKSGERLFQYPFNKVGDYSIPNSVTIIEGYAFQNCVGLTALNVPISIDTIAFKAFDGCVNLRSVSMPSVAIIGGFAFHNCISLTTVELGNFVITVGGSAFKGCSALESISMPSTITTIGSHAFEGCVSLISANIPSNIKGVGAYAYYGCASLTDAIIPATLTVIGNHAFEGCDSLASIDVDPANPNYKSVNGVMFSKDGKTLIQYPCGKGNEYSIPAGVEIIGEGAFGGCVGLVSLKIPSSVQTIADDAFVGVCHGENAVPGAVVGHQRDSSHSIGADGHECECDCGYVWTEAHHMHDGVCSKCGYADESGKGFVLPIAIAIVIIAVIAAVSLLLRKN